MTSTRQTEGRGRQNNTHAHNTSRNSPSDRTTSELAPRQVTTFVDKATGNVPHCPAPLQTKWLSRSISTIDPGTNLLLLVAVADTNASETWESPAPPAIAQGTAFQRQGQSLVAGREGPMST
jgi:hypothetical protein